MQINPKKQCAGVKQLSDNTAECKQGNYVYYALRKAAVHFSLGFKRPSSKMFRLSFNCPRKVFGKRKYWKTIKIGQYQRSTVKVFITRPNCAFCEM